MNLKMERERRADMRESRSDLKDAALVREKAARLELQLKHSEEKAAAAAAAERLRVAHDVISPISGTSIQPIQSIQPTQLDHSVVDALPVVSHTSGTSTLKNYFFNEK